MDTYSGCPHGCRYCFSRAKYERQQRGRPQPESIRPTSLTIWEKVLNGEKVRNPMVQYLVAKKHPVQLGTKADPFPRGVEREVQNTRKFIELCNRFKYPVYINTKNTDVRDMPVDLLVKGNYVLGVSIISHRVDDTKRLEKNTIEPIVRLRQIPTGIFKKIIVRWQPFIPQLYEYRARKSEKINWGEIDRYLDAISDTADAVSLSFINPFLVRDQWFLEEIGPDDLTELEDLEILTYIKQQAHQRQLEFYTSNYRALSDSPICCGLRGDEFEISAKWVWSYLIWKLFSGEKEYLTEQDLIDAFPAALKEEKFASLNIPLYSRWARYCSKKNTILDEYIRNFTTNRKMNPANYYAGLYSRVVDGEFRIYFKDYRNQTNG